MAGQRAADQLYGGVDVAAETFVAAWLVPDGAPAAPVSGEQTAAGFAELQHRLQSTGVPPAATLVVLEATSAYRVALAVTLHEAGYAVSVASPRQAHHFAKARRAAALRPAPWTPPPAVYHEVRQRLVPRDGLLATRTQARHQRHALLQWPVVVDGVRQHLDELIAARETEIAAALRARVWAEPLACLTSAPGIGLVTASWLLVGTLHFALCAGPASRAAYAGLAPMPRESGRSIRGRPAIGHDGNRRLRTALYMATLSAARCNPAIRAFYQRLRASGKPPEVARCAAARKLLHQAWALGAKRRRFEPHHGQPHQEASPGPAA